ncbi:MAG TPA: SDR family oxidoreductase [Ktedonobacteraceae bacterium]|jgi:3-oxoacyl-[acyl-carrier protein] reductase|nr:SDR family oxidoreductase [Ktedonobacteraceae bacterium]
MFQEKTVVVTGAGRGIGRALALGFAKQGARVLVHYGHAQSGAEEVVRQIREGGGSAQMIQADLGKTEAVRDLVSQAHAQLGKIDVWINNAGASANSRETVGMSEVEIFERLMQVDVLGTWLCSREVAPYMNDGGCILTTGWDAALSGAEGLPSQIYAMSKGAIISLTRCLALEYAPRLRVNCIAPGYVENEWSQSLAEKTRQHLQQANPLQRLGTPEDIVGTALFLASPAAAFITGQVILVNGGEVMR